MNDIATGAAPVEHPVTAGFWPRLLALMIDWVACLFAVRAFLPRDVSFASPDYSRAVLIAFAVEVAVLTWLTGASAGQRICRLRVQRWGGGRVGIGRVLIRTALLCLAVPALLADRDGRGLHDKVADTVVLRAT